MARRMQTPSLFPPSPPHDREQLITLVLMHWLAEKVKEVVPVRTENAALQYVKRLLTSCRAAHMVCRLAECREIK